jgi:hypothetical protein
MLSARPEARHGELGPLDVIEIFPARFALLVILALWVQPSHPFVHVDLAKHTLVLAGCRDGHDDLQKIY